MMTRAALSVWMAVIAAETWLAERVESARHDETGSPTLETVAIAAGLLALALGLVLVIKTAVSHYSAQIQ